MYAWPPSGVCGVEDVRECASLAVVHVLERIEGVLCRVKNPRTRNIRHLVVYEKSAWRRWNCFVKSDVEFVFHYAAGAVEPFWSAVAAAAKKERSKLIVSWKANAEPDLRNLCFGRALETMKQTQHRVPVELFFASAVIAAFVIFVVYSVV
jgi:hypothetical protein